MPSMVNCSKLFLSLPFFNFLMFQVLDEIGVSVGEQLGTAPSGTGGVKEAEASKDQDPINAELQARLDNLRRM